MHAIHHEATFVRLKSYARLLKTNHRTREGLRYPYSTQPQPTKAPRNANACLEFRITHNHAISRPMLPCSCLPPPNHAFLLPEQVDVRFWPAGPHKWPIPQPPADRREHLEPPSVLIHISHRHEPHHGRLPDRLGRVVDRGIHDCQRPVRHFGCDLGPLQAGRPVVVVLVVVCCKERS